MVGGRLQSPPRPLIRRGGGVGVVRGAGCGGGGIAEAVRRRGGASKAWRRRRLGNAARCCVRRDGDGGRRCRFAHRWLRRRCGDLSSLCRNGEAAAGLGRSKWTETDLSFKTEKGERRFLAERACSVGRPRQGGQATRASFFTLRPLRPAAPEMTKMVPKPPGFGYGARPRAHRVSP